MSKTKPELELELSSLREQVRQRGRQVERLTLELALARPTPPAHAPRRLGATRAPDNVKALRDHLRASLPKRNRYA